MLNRLILAVFLAGITATPALAQAGAPSIQGVGVPGTQRGGIVTVQGDPGGTGIPVTPSQYSSTNLSGTIATSNTFQSIQTYNSGRIGCLIQNQSLTDTMWVYFGPIAGATKGKSFELDTTHGLQISCPIGGTSVVQDQVSITGTSTDGFTANFQ